MRSCHAVSMQTFIARTCLSLSLLAIGTAAIAQKNQKLTVEAQRQCLVSGGKLATMGLSGNQGCVHPTRDAGKSCTDGTQCTAGCFLDERQASFKRPKAGAKVAGVCAPTDFPFGCRTAVVNGKAGIGLCVD